MSADPAPRHSLSAQRLAAQLLDESDREFLEALRSAGSLAELDESELLRIASEVNDDDPDGRRGQMLELYYDAAGDADAAARRRQIDRFFVQRVEVPVTARGLVERFAAIVPELEAVRLERIGGGADGPLVLRSGENFAAVLDDYDEETDTDQYDLELAAARKSEPAMVTVRGLVRAVNVLLDKRDVRERLVAIRCDLDREIYLSLGVTEAIGLASLGFLEDEEPEDVMDLGAW